MIRLGCLLIVVLGACGASEDDRPARWSYIATAIVLPNCATAGCHSKQTATAGLQLDTVDGAYTQLVGPSGRGNFVIPGDPERSQIMHLLRGTEIKRMPPDQPLPNADIELVERWILAGAKAD
jgi:hypothetical protein